MKLPIPSKVIPSKVKKLWDAWDLRLSIITSLLLQAFLLLLAPSRQRSRSNLLFRSIWATYLLADWVAAVAIGLISKSLSEPDDPEGNDDLFALWASFLLMHLGGPDGITSLSLEDNELWIRHLFGLFLQVISAAYSFYLTLTRNRLWFPTVLVFIAGNIKFSERTLALRKASLERFGATTLPDPNPGPDYQEAELVYSTMRSVQVQSTVAEMMTTTMSGGVSNFVGTEGKSKEVLDEMKLLEIAYSLFETFKELIVGFLLSSKDRESSRSYFLQRTATEAFRLVEYELSFMYQVLHTKALVIHGKTGYSFRFISICSTISAFLVFLFIGKQGFGKFERDVTYALFIGAIVLDTIASLNLLISDWILMAFKESWVVKKMGTVILRRIRWSGKRWSGSVSQKNIINHCLVPDFGVGKLTSYHYLRKLSSYNNVRKLVSYHYFRKLVLIMKKILCNVSYSETVSTHLKNFIFDELLRKSKKASNLRDAIEACSQRGDSALLQSPSSYIKLKWSIGEFQYAESLLLWHLATELCYHHDEIEKPNSTTTDHHREGENFLKLLYRSCVCQGRQGDAADTKRICKLLSNYMFYLLVEKSVMLGPVLGNWNIVFRDTSAEAKRFFNKYKLSCHAEACEKILSVKPKVRSAAIKGDRSKSVLFDACILAQQLLKEENLWEIMSRVWVEMLSYAAINCRPFIHGQQLSKGGELLTFTWLLMNHLGLGTQFAEQEQQAGKKMVPIMESD